LEVGKAGTDVLDRTAEALRRAAYQNDVLARDRVDLGDAVPDDPVADHGHGVERGGCRRHAPRFQGANGFLTPRNAGSSSGKWRSRTVRIVLPSIQSMPSFV